MSLSREIVLAKAAKQSVLCGGCGKEAKPVKVLAFIPRPQWDGVSAFSLVEYRCETPDCDTAIPLEIDL